MSTEPLVARAAATRVAKPTGVEVDLEGGNRAVTPVIRTQPEAGNKGLFVNPGRTVGLQGFTQEESDAILGVLYDHATRPEHIYRHRWRQGDMVMWDNRSLMHYAICDYGDQPRYMERTTAIGDRPV